MEQKTERYRRYKKRDRKKKKERKQDQNMASLTTNPPPRKKLKQSTIEALKEKPLRKIYIGSFVVPAGVEST